MNVPTVIAEMCAKEGGFLEGEGRTGTWWKDGRAMVTWRWSRAKREFVINCTPRQDRVGGRP
jgi:hypothetical protein